MITQQDKLWHIVEMYTGDDDKTYFRNLLINTPIPHPLGAYSDPCPATGIVFRQFNANAFFDWHTAPQAQYIIYLEGEVEVKTSGGETRRFTAGDILLANDTRGAGHITKTLSAGRSLIVKV
ncbi:MAG: Cupin domain [Gammaproteobacteria bacterium]|jgi:hypothetical protein|nr:Cupin domain [Gammaproteobacteria bacterium]